MSDDASEHRLTLSVEEAARLLGVSPGLVYELVRRGRLRAVRLGRRILIPRHAIETLVDPPDDLAGASSQRPSSQPRIDSR